MSDFGFLDFCKARGSNHWNAVWVLIMFTYILATTYPIYLDRILDSSTAASESFFFQKVRSPLTSVVIPGNTHGSKIAFRLTIPLLAKALGLGGAGATRKVIIIYLLQSLLLLPFLWMIFHVCLRRLNRHQALFFTWACAGTYMCRAFFWDVDYWFDGFAYFFLLSGMFFRRRALIFCLLTAACWTDERAVVALLPTWLFHQIEENEHNLSNVRQIFNRQMLSGRSFMAILALLSYIVIRIALSVTFHISTPIGKGAGVSGQLVIDQLKMGSNAIFLTFEGLWIVFLAAFWLLIRQRNFLMLSLLSLSVVVHIGVAFSVFDITRSLCYAFPLMLISVQLLSDFPRPIITCFVTVATIISLAVPQQFFAAGFYPVPTSVSSIEKFRCVVDLVLAFL